MELLYSNDDPDMVADRIIADEELSGCGLGKRKVLKTLKSFEGDEIACSVFLKKYALRDDQNQIIEFTLEEAKERWAKAVFSAEELFPDGEKQTEQYFKELYNYFLPAGRQMFALGNAYITKTTLTNCYVTKIEEDSLEGIYEAAKKLARTFSYGGGIGLCIGELRPAAAKVANSARHSTGAASFLELFSSTTGLIGQAGRRGALMVTIPIDHPDVELFTEMKHNNSDKVKHANLSIKITDKFMKAVENNEDFTLSFSTRHEEISRTVKAKDLWDKIIQSARDSAEPGILFWDRAQDLSPSDIYPRLRIHSTNPCISKDAWIHTEHGPRQVQELIGVPFVARVNGKLYKSTKNGFFQTGVKRLNKVVTKEGFELRLTDSHLIKTPNGWKKTGDLQPGDKIVLNKNRLNHSNSWSWDQQTLFGYEKGYLLGLLIGDGTIKKDSAVLSVFNECVEKGVSGVKNEVINCVNTIGLKRRSDFNGWLKIKDRDESRFTLKAIKDLSKEYGFSNKDKNIKHVIENESSEFYMGFLRAFFDADGSVQGNLQKGISIRLSQSNIHNLKCVQRMLARLGIVSQIYCNRRAAGFRTMPDGHGQHKQYYTQASHELVISNDNIIEYNRIISFSHSDKKEKLHNLVESYKRTPNKESFVVEVKDIIKDKVEAVYDAQIPDINMFDANGVIVHNCGEQLLEPGSACVLGSLLLHTFVKNPYTKEAQFDYELFNNMVERSVRHLDDIVELNLTRHPLKEQQESAQLGRRIGLGLTGLADTCAALGIQYDSDEALVLIDKIMVAKRDTEYLSSIKLAKERGSFPLFDVSRHFERGFCATLPQHIKDEAKKYGLRNVALSTVAPSGSLSIIAQCSSGIEPIFALTYHRYVELGAERKKFTICHPGLKRFHSTGFNGELPSYWRVAHEINHVYRIRLQGLIQKYVDASISSTINLPKDISAQVVSDIYINAWKQGLKGITVYREGSREGVLLTDEFAKQAGIPDMDSIVHCVRAEGGDKFYITISYLNKDIREPYQVFVMNYKKTDTDAFIKISNSLIKMLLQNGVCEKRVQKYIDRSTNSLVKLTRFLSLSMKTDNLQSALQIVDENAYAGTLAAKLVQILQKSINARSFTCPRCNSSNIKTEEGCISCLDCQWSGCS